MRSLRRGHDRVVNYHPHAITFQFINDVDDSGVTKIWTVLLERQAKNVHDSAVHFAAALDHEFHRFASDVPSHAVIDAPSSQDHLRVVADLLGPVGEIVWIDTDTVAADQAWAERQKIPFRAGDFQYLDGVEAKPVENDRQLVHERDVEVALRVLDDLRRFGCLDA